MRADDLLIAPKPPQDIISILSIKQGFKIKGTGPISYHLCCNFGRDNDFTLHFSSCKRVDKLIDCCYSTFSRKSKIATTAPSEKGDYPELDTTECLDQQGVDKHESLIGALQWAVSLGSFDADTDAMVLHPFRRQPRIGHLERKKGSMLLCKVQLWSYLHYNPRNQLIIHP